MRNSALSLGIFFLVGLGFLLLVTIPKKALSVQNT
jgi:UMF1 family MFS transporter